MITLQIGDLKYSCYSYTKTLFIDDQPDSPKKYWSFYLKKINDSFVNIEEIQNILKNNNNTIIIIQNNKKQIEQLSNLDFCYFDEVNNFLNFKLKI